VATGAIPASVFALRAVEQAWFDFRIGPLTTGFLLGAGLASVPWALWTLALSVDGSVSWRVGADAERWTANELHRLGASWHIVHNVPFPEHGYPNDVDHIAIGPCGVLAVETKWTSASLDLGAKRLPKDVLDAVRQAEANAGRVRGLLRRVAEIDVIPLVVFWGRDVTAADEPVRSEGKVRIVAGAQAALWRPLLNAQRIDEEMVERLSARAQGWLADQEEKTIGAVVHRRLSTARRLGLVSMAITAVVMVLFPAANVSAGLDRFLGAVFSFGGGIVGAALFLLPLVLALGTLAFVHVARRLDPAISLGRGTVPLLFWCAALGGILLLAP
jgi:hypothetical protein